MPLTFNYENVANKDVVCTDPNDPDKFHPVLDAIVMLSMVCGYNDINERTYRWIHKRIAQYEAIVGAYLGYTGEDNKRKSIYITLEDVQRYIGLTLNTTRTQDSQWRLDLARIARRQTESLLYKQGSAYDFVQRLHEAKQKETANG